jgi:hypothetical protein
MRVVARIVAISIVFLSIAARFIFPIDFVYEKGERVGYSYPVMTDAGVAYSDAWGAISSYIVILAFLLLMLVLRVTKR